MNNLYKYFFSTCIFILFLSLLIGCGSSEQIRTSKPQDPKSNVKVEEDVVTPYDGSYLHMEVYPSLNHYKKYIGQQLYLPPLTGTQQSFRLFTDTGFKRPYKSSGGTIWTWHYVWHPDMDNVKTVRQAMNSKNYARDKDALTTGLHRAKGDMELFSNDESFVCDKYYTIIEVLSVVSETYNRHHPEPYDRYYFAGIGRGLALNEKPYFVLREKKTKNLVYTTQSDEFILVEGFENIKKKHKPLVGKTIYRLNVELDDDDSSGDQYIKKEATFKCIDIVLNTSTSGHKINLLLRDKNGDDEEIEYTDLIWEQRNKGGRYMTESLYNTLKK